jgi:3-dehydroquinate dehydratase
MEIIVKILNYGDFVNEVKVKIRQLDYEDIITDGIKEAINNALYKMTSVVINEQFQILIRDAVKEIVIPKIKEKLKEQTNDRVISGIVESILKDVVELAKDIEKDSERIRQYIKS